MQEYYYYYHSAIYLSLLLYHRLNNKYLIIFKPFLTITIIIFTIILSFITYCISIYLNILILSIFYLLKNFNE